MFRKIMSLLLTAALLCAMFVIGTAEEKIELTCITPLLDSSVAKSDEMVGQEKAFHRAMDTLQAEFPNVTFVYEEYPHSTYEDKIKSLAAANSLPDIFFLKATMVKPLVDAGQIISFDDALAADPEWAGNFRAGMFTEATYQDKIWAIPEYSSMNGMLYYNKALLAELGYDAFPDTMEGLWELIDAAKAKGIIPMFAGATGGWEPFSLFQNALLYRYVGSQWAADLVAHKDTVSFNDQAFIDAAAEGVRFANEAFNEDWYEIGSDEAIYSFATGNSLMCLNGSWAITSILTSGMDAEDLGIAALPMVEGQTAGDSAIPGSTGWMLFASKSVEGAKYDAAVRFIQLMSDAEYATIRLENNEFPAMNASDTVDMSKVSIASQLHDEVVAKNGQGLVIDCVMDPQVVEVLYQDCTNLYLGNITPERFAQNAQAEYEAVLAAD